MIGDRHRAVTARIVHQIEGDYRTIEGHRRWNAIDPPAWCNAGAL